MFNYKGFLRFTQTALFKTQNTHYRLTPKRICWAIAFCLFYPLLELYIWAGLLLDDVFLAGYRRQEIREPVFILGNPRSGTTLLHRLMSLDVGQFLSMRTWEIFFAPAIVQRKVWRALGRLDRRLGSPLHRALTSWENWCRARLVTHEIALHEPEEDEFMLLHAWSTLTVSQFSAVMDQARAYTYFDTALSSREKQRVMAFYRRCLQRHLYAHGAGTGSSRRYLAKSPSLCPKVGTLLERFPDAKFIYLVRDPVEMIPSYISVMHIQWSALGDPLTDWASRDYVLDMARHWYDYPLQRLEQDAPDRYVVIRYDDLVRAPERTVGEIYRRLGFSLSPEFAGVLSQEAKRSQDYDSRHKYSLQEMGLSREQIATKFRDVYQRFGLDSHDGTNRNWHEEQPNAVPALHYVEK